MFLAASLWNATRVEADADGLRDGQSFTYRAAEALRMDLRVRPASRLANARLTLDGQPLLADRTTTGFTWQNDKPLLTGAHQLELTVPRPILPASVHRWRFVVDADPPVIESPTLLPPRGMRDAVRINGRVDTDAVLTANDEPVDVDDDGGFVLEYPSPPAGGVRLKAVDPAGHKVFRRIAVPLTRPRVRGVHVSGAAWATKEIRAGVLRLIDEGKINTVQLDVKDESGELVYDSKLPLARRAGAVKRYFDLEQAVQDLHRRKVRVVARVVAFRDPLLAAHAWRGGHRSWVVQTPDGRPHGAYGGFTNFADRDVQSYNLAVAKEAVDAGVDEVIWDYVRRPEGDLASMRFPGLDETPEQSIVGFLGRAQAMLRARGVYQGVSIFGIAAQRPTTIGQNVPAIARVADYVAPMVYPSLWVSGEYKVADPARMPYDIVFRSLGDFQDQMAGTGAHLTPWLQDFSLSGVAYSDAEVRSQIRAAQERGIQDWLLWSPRVRYHTGGVLSVEDDRF